MRIKKLNSFSVAFLRGFLPISLGAGVVLSMLGCVHSMIAKSSSENPEIQKKEAAYNRVAEYTKLGPAHEFVLSPEGEFVSVFNPTVKDWVSQKWDLAQVKVMQNALKESVSIALTPKGFVKAANREIADGEKDDTNYDAVWVRDSAWVYWTLQEVGKKDDARKLLLSLWDYYATPAQLLRLRALIADPLLVKDKMAVPHIRFNGNSPKLDDVMVKGQPEVWNHRQMDAHGLFVMAVLNGLKTGVIQESDINKIRLEALTLLPVFFNAVEFWNLEDAGAWEEVDRRNTSSIAIVTRSMMMLKEFRGPKSGKRPWVKEMDSILSQQKIKIEPLLAKLISKGQSIVREQVAAEGESPIYNAYQKPSLFRRADAALFNVLLPQPLPGLTEVELRITMASLESLKRPAGVLRYINDSYQSGNFWVQAPGAKAKEGTAGTTGDTSDEKAFKVRLEALIPHTEAQWFFDSQLAMARLELRKLALQRKDHHQAQQDLMMAVLHLKRALGQITGQISGRPLITADGLPIKDWQIPESINTVVIEGRPFYLPSPITPLNWAKASLELALFRLEESLREEKP